MQKSAFLRACVLSHIAFLVSVPAHAIDLGENAKYGKILGEFRVREEFFDRDTKPKSANAGTGRLRLGYLTPTYEGLSGYLEGETIRYIGNDNFDDGMNRKSRYPAIGDPHDTAVNQAYLSYAYPGTGNRGVVGRQVIQFDNDRFIGRSNWRQNDTTHDGARITLQPIKELTLDYAYSADAHRGPGQLQTLGQYLGDMNMLHASYALPQHVKASAYSYSLDFDPYVKSGTAASTQLSSRTQGARFEWKPEGDANSFVPQIIADTAFQTNIGNNRNNLEEWYGWYELGGKYQGFALSGVVETLGGNGHASVQTPLASSHSFNGWAEKFTTKPNGGLEDYFLVFKAPIPLPAADQKLSFDMQLHQFTANTTDSVYGKEIDAGLSYVPMENNTIAVQMGRYYAHSYSDDTTKVYIYYELKF